MGIRSRINKLEERIPRRRSLEGLSPKEMTDDELKEIICHGAGITPAELTDEKLKKIAGGDK
jgi:hypothetical protein